MTEQFFTTALKDIIQEIRMQNLTKHVRTFHGEGTAKFQNWLTDMDQLAITIDSEKMCVLATLTLGGLAGTFVSRYMKENPQTQWQTLRAKLRERFSDAADLAYAQEQCRRTRQKKDENIQNFAERLRTAAADAFDNLASPDTQRTLVEIFQKGVQSDYLSRQIIRKKFTNFEQAVDFAVDETRADRTFQLCRDRPAPQEPMDVDAVRTDDKLDQLRTDVDRLTKQLDRMTRRPHHPSNPPRAPFRPQSAPPRFRQVPSHPQSRGHITQRPHHITQRPPTSAAHMTYVPDAASAPPPQPPSNPYRQQYQPGPAAAGFQPTPYQHPPPATDPSPASAHATRTPYQWTHDGKPICAACGRVGHIRRQCRRAVN